LDGKAEFSVITPVFSVTCLFRNHSAMLIWCSRTFCIAINVYSFLSLFLTAPGLLLKLQGPVA